jgi:Ni,Fe-hydrogenase I large subunit
MDITQQMKDAETKATYFRGIEEQRMRDAQTKATYFRGIEEQRMRDTEADKKFAHALCARL